MSDQKKHHSEGDTVVLTTKTKVPITVIVSAMCLAGYITYWFNRMEYDMREALTIQQAQEWIDTSREVNRQNFPGLIWPALPARSGRDTVGVIQPQKQPMTEAEKK